MKIQSTIFLILFALAIACSEDTPIQDPVHEFVAFKEAGPVNLNEFDNSTTAYPLVVQLYAFQPYSEDVTVQYTATGTNATEGVDFTVTPASSITLKAGKLTSDTIWIKTINNDGGSVDPRSFNISLTGASKADIKLGLGLADPKQKAIAVNILDDECSATADIFSADLSNKITLNGEVMPTPNNATGTLVGNELSIDGDVYWYADTPISLVITLDPGTPGSKGSATIGTQFMGEPAGDGYEYQFEEIGTGTYDVCGGKIIITYKVTYRALGETDWTNWGDRDVVINEFTLK